MFDTTGYVFQTWWDGNDMWDGNAHYADLDSAKFGAEEDYKEAEYYVPGSYWYEFFTQEDKEEPVLSWKPVGKQLWHLYDEEDATGVAIQICSVYSLKESA